MQFLRQVLKNGITVVMEKRELPVVAASISNPFGAAFETSKIKGIAHFIEHLVFTGTKTRTHEDISREIEKKGGILNAFTSNEITSFWFKLPSEHLFTGFDILVDMIKNPLFDEKKFEKEKKVIIEEIKMYHDTPQRHIFNTIESNLYNKPFGEGIIGSAETINALTRDFVYDYFKKHYMTAPFVVTVVGNADFEKVCSYFEKNFTSSSSLPKPQKLVVQNKESVEKRKGIDQAHFVLAFHAPLLTEPDYYALEVLDAYLANGMSSRLFLKIREEKGLAYSVRGSINVEKSYGYYTIYAGTTKEAIPEVKKIMLEELKKSANMNENNLKEAKERVIGLRKISAEESSTVMNELVFNELVHGAGQYYEHEKKIRAVTLEQVRKFAGTKNFSMASIVPK